MPPTPDDALLRDLAGVATQRHDALEARVRVLELALARAEGASTGWARAQPWVTTVIAGGALAWSVLRPAG